MTTKIESRSALIADLVHRESRLKCIGLETLPDTVINQDTPDTFNIANAARVQEMVIRVLLGLQANTSVSQSQLKTLFRNLTSEGTAVGYLAQFQAYDWLLAQGTKFEVEVSHSSTVRGNTIDLDGRIDALSQPVFFDIKSFGFEPDLRATFQRRLEERLSGFSITIDGPGNHGPDAVTREAFSRLSNHVSSLESTDCIHIEALNWTVTKRAREPGMQFAEHEYDPTALIKENREVPLKNSSQFATDAPYVLFFTLPDGVGSSPLKRNIFGITEKLFTGIAEYLFTAGRTDVRGANAFDKTVPSKVTVADVISKLSALAVYAPQADFIAIHLNGQATWPLSIEDADAIASGWRAVRHP